MLLSLSALLSAYCDLRFLRLPQRQGIFSSWTQFWTSQVIIRAVYSVSFSAFKMAFPKSSLAKYRCLHIKNHTYFMSSITTERLYKSLSFITSSAQIFLKLYSGGFTRNNLYNTICMILIWLISSYRSEKIELIRSFKNRIIHISMQKIATISQFIRSD